MTFTVTKKDLLAIAEVMDLVPSRPGVPSSEFFRVSPNKGGIQICLASEITADAQLKGEGHWPFKKDFYLDRRVFIPFVTASKDIGDMPFKFSAKDKKTLQVRQGGRRAVFDGQTEVTGYGFPPKAELISKLKLDGRLRELVYCGRECSTADPVTPQLNCVYVVPNGSSVSVYATNQKILYQGKTASELKSTTPIPFPLYLVQILGSDKLKEVHWKDKYVSLLFKQGRIWQPVSSKARTGFPLKVIRKHIKLGKQAPVLFEVSGKRFVKVTSRLCYYLGSVRRQDWTLVLSAKKRDRVLLLESKIPQSVFRERIKLKSKTRGDVELSWPLDMLEPIFAFLGAHKDTIIKVRVDENGRSHITAGEISLVIPKRTS